MRAFVAISFDEPIRRRLQETQAALRRADADVKWVEERNLHLNLKFLGEVSEDQVTCFRERLRQEAGRYPPFEIDIRGVGRFPKSGPPRVLWAGCQGEVSKLLGLAGAIERAALEVGVPREERPFTPHLTLGRVKSLRNTERLRNALEARHDDVFGHQRIPAFDLIRSTLTGKGPLYEVLESFPLSHE